MSKRTAILTALLLLVLALLAWNRFHQVILSAIELNLESRRDTLTATDYSVYSSFLQGQSEISIGSGRNASIVAPFTAAFPTFALTSEDKGCLKQQLPSLQDSTIAAFLRCVSIPSAVAPRFSVSHEYAIANAKEATNVEVFLGRFPNALGLVQFSCVAYDRSGTQAFFSVERRMTRSAIGEYVLMEKTPNGSWRLKGRMLRWLA